MPKTATRIFLIYASKVFPSMSNMQMNYNASKAESAWAAEYINVEIAHVHIIKEGVFSSAFPAELDFFIHRLKFLGRQKFVPLF